MQSEGFKVEFRITYDGRQVAVISGADAESMLREAIAAFPGDPEKAIEAVKEELKQKAAY